MLSKNQRRYLNKKLDPKPSYRRKLHHEIKTKAIKALEDFALILSLPREQRCKLFVDDKIVAEALTAIHIMWQESRDYTDEKNRLTLYARQVGRLMLALTKAGIPYDTSRLTRDKDYRLEKINELKSYERKTGKKVYSGPTGRSNSF